MFALPLQLNLHIFSFFLNEIRIHIPLESLALLDGFLEVELVVGSRHTQVYALL